MPCRNSSTRIRSPADPKTRSSKKSAIARFASSAFSAVKTPLPPARPSAFSTTGNPKSLIARRASSAVAQTRAWAVGILWRAEELLREHLRRLDLCREPRRAENRQIPLRELVHDSERERKLRPDHRQVELELLGEIRDLDDVARRDRQAVGDLRDSGIARRAIDLAHRRTAPQAGAERMLAPSRADDQDFHARHCNRCPRGVSRRHLGGRGFAGLPRLDFPAPRLRAPPPSEASAGATSNRV